MHYPTLLLVSLLPLLLPACGGGGRDRGSIVAAYSIADQDGTVFERLQANGLPQRGAAHQGLRRVGHDRSGARNRMVFTFELPGYVHGKQIRSAYLVLHQQPGTMGTPYALLGRLIVEQIPAGSTLVPDLMNATGVRVGDVPLTDGTPGEVHVDVKAALQRAADAREDHVQLRARFDRDGGFSRNDHYVNLADGETGQPRLVIEYR